MKRVMVGVLAGVVLVAGAGPALADVSVSLGGASATAAGDWYKPDRCSQLPVTYQGLPVGESAQVMVLDALTRTDVGSAYITSSAPRDGRVNVQVCSHNVEQTQKVLLSLVVGQAGVSDSAAFAWVPRPDYVRCVNKRTYRIQEYQAKRCPAGWVKG